MAAKTEGLTTGNLVKEERANRGSRQEMLVDENQTLVRGAVCRSGPAGRKVALGVEVNEVQTINLTGTLSAGTYTLSFVNEAGATVKTGLIPYNVSDNSAMQTIVDTAMPAGEVVVGGTKLTANTFTFSGKSVKGKAQPKIRVDYGELTGAQDVTVTRTTKGGWGAGGGADEVQTLAMAGTITGGTYTISITDESGDVQTTGDIAYNDNNAAINTELDSTLGNDQVVATGTIITACVFTFSGSNYEKRNQPLLTVDMSSLTGGGSTYTVAKTTKGGAAGKPEADSICLEAVTTAGSAFTTKTLFLTNQAIVLIDNLDFGDGNKIDAIQQLADVGIIVKNAAPEGPNVQP